MKKIVNKSLQTALLRGAVLVSGCTATAVTSLFFNNIYGVVATWFIGVGVTALIDEVIVTLTKGIYKNETKI